MKRAALAFITGSILLSACKGKYYNNPTASMESTLEVGGRFRVVNSDEFERNDIVVYQVFCDDLMSPPDENGKFPKHWEERVSRVIAMSGDTLLIREGDVYINNKLIPLPEKALTEYEIHSLKPLDDLPDRYTEYVEAYFGRSGDTMHYRAYLTQAEVKQFESRSEITLLKKKIGEAIEPHPNFPFAACKDTCRWSADNYGPLVIPATNTTIDVDDNNFIIYANIPGIGKGRQMIKEPLYFLMGDNRHMASDSRFIGFISHSNMHGIVK